MPNTTPRASTGYFPNQSDFVKDLSQVLRRIFFRLFCKFFGNFYRGVESPCYMTADQLFVGSLTRWLPGGVLFFSFSSHSY
jgi:hypothetical protein